MPKSMTAFGRGLSPAAEGSFTVEIRTVNSRFLDVHLRLPPALAGLEERVKKYLAERLTRGRVSLSVSALGAALPQPRLVLNAPLVAEYQRVLNELKAELGSDQTVGLEPFLNNRDLIQVEETAPDLDQVWSLLEPALDSALAEVVAMRAAEGENIARDLLERMEKLGELFKQVAARQPMIVEAFRQRLNERIAELLDNSQVDPQRVAVEVAIIADKCDISEEAVRATSHLDQFRGFLAADEPVGRKLDFLLQELNREANTMGSKSPDADSGALVVELKAELERIREQVQNLE